MKIYTALRYVTKVICILQGYYTGYDPKVNPGIRNAFQAAAFRFGHSLLTDTQDRYNKFHQKLGK